MTLQGAVFVVAAQIDPHGGLFGLLGAKSEALRIFFNILGVIDLTFLTMRLGLVVA